MEYAVIETGGKQYKVSPGSVITVERLNDTKALSFDKVLLYVNGDDFSVGKPYLEGFSVSAKLLDEIRGEKIRVSRFKAKANYRRTTGHRQSLSKVEIEKIVKNATKSENKSTKQAKSAK